MIWMIPSEDMVTDKNSDGAIKGTIQQTTSTKSLRHHVLE